MATLQAQNLLPMPSSSSSSHRSNICSSLQLPINRRSSPNPRLSSKLPTTINLDELSSRHILEETTTSHNSLPTQSKKDANQLLLSKLYAIANVAADRAEMHVIIGEQRNNWAHLLLNSTNSITLAAILMAGLSAVPDIAPVLLPFKISSALLFAAASGVMMLTGKIQPSQLAEEQRNAARLFRQLEKSIHTDLTLGSPPTQNDVQKAMARVLALDKAYPLPLLPGMLEKFPEAVEPTVWWPKLDTTNTWKGMERKGWNGGLEEEMKGALRVLKEKDTEEYVKTGKLVLKISKILSVSGPMLAGAAAVAVALIGNPVIGELATMVGVVGGAMAAVANTLQHGGQVGMVFELMRNVAGFYRQMEEEIEANLDGRGEDDGELFETIVALRLGRSIEEMKELAKYGSSEKEVEEFAGKLF